MSLNFGRVPPLTAEFAALERLKNQPISLLNSTLESSFLIGSSSFLPVTRTTVIVSGEIDLRPDHPKQNLIFTFSALF